jgi:hypothetical protein
MGLHFSIVRMGGGGHGQSGPITGNCSLEDFSATCVSSGTMPTTSILPIPHVKAEFSGSLAMMAADGVSVIPSLGFWWIFWPDGIDRSVCFLRQPVGLSALDATAVGTAQARALVCHPGR